MPLTTSNTLTQTSTPAMSAALQKKINQQPLSFSIFSPAAGFTPTQNKPVNAPTAGGSAVPIAPVGGLIAKTNNAQTSAPTSATAPVSAPKAAVQTSYQGGQNVPAPGSPEYIQAQKLAAQTTPTPAPATPVTAAPTNPGLGLYQSFLQQGTDAAKQAAELNKKIALGTASVEGNPNLSIDTQVGRAGLIQRNLGTQATAAANTAEAAFRGASAAAPVQVPYGTQFGSPIDIANASASGAPAGGALNPLNNVQSLAQQVIAGQISPAQAYAMGGNITNFSGVLNHAIQAAKPGFNTATAQGAFDAKQANTVTSGTTPTTTAAGVYSTAYPQLLDLQNSVRNVDNFGHLLTSNMVDKNGDVINPHDVKYANTVLANIKSELSSEQQATFDTTFAQLKAQIAALLASGGAQIPTQITADANKIIDGSLPLSSLDAVLQRIATEGKILESNLQNKVNTAGSTISAPKVGGAAGGSNPLGI